MAVILHRFTES